MASSKQNSLYPEIDNTNPEKPNSSTSSSTSPSIYPTVDVSDLAEKLFPEETDAAAAESAAAAPPHEDLLIRIPGAIVHLIEKDRSVELACGDLDIVSFKQGETVVAAFCRIGGDIQWPLAKDEAAVKLDQSHYFFTLRVPSGSQEFGDDDEDEHQSGDDEELLLNYGVTFASKGQEALLKRFDEVLESFSAFTVQEVANDKIEGSEMIDGTVARETTPEEFSKGGKKKELMKESSAAYWTVIAPNVEDYSSSLARMIAAGSGHVIKGILWCGDVTADRLKWGNDFFLRKLKKGEAVAVRPGTLRRIKRVKKLTKMSENVALGILTGVVKVSGFFTSPIVNSKVGKKFFSLLPGEIVLASLDGFNKICDAVEVAGKNVMSTSSVVTTGLVSHKYGEQAGKATNDGFDAAGHAIGTAWAVFKIRKALNPKSSFKPSSLAKAAAKASAKELKSKSMK
ncbi:Protein EARLY-RESPONSIVE TO DEHYDRATION 7, chloroplastic [Linum perenne]